MTTDKLRKILNNHGIIFSEINESFYCKTIALSEETELLSIIDGKTHCNNKPINIMEWLGY